MLKILNRMLCSHVWDRENVYAGDAGDNPNVRSISVEDPRELIAMLMGETRWLLQCNKCGYATFSTSLGAYRRYD